MPDLSAKMSRLGQQKTGGKGQEQDHQADWLCQHAEGKPEQANQCEEGCCQDGNQRNLCNLFVLFDQGL